MNISFIGLFKDRDIFYIEEPNSIYKFSTINRNHDEPDVYGFTSKIARYIKNNLNYLIFIYCNFKNFLYSSFYYLNLKQ